MLPYDNDQQGFAAENFDVRIKGSAALLDYKGDKVKANEEQTSHHLRALQRETGGKHTAAIPR